MKPVQVHLTDSEARELAAWAKTRRVTMSDVIRQAVRAVVRSGETDPLFAAIGMLSGRGDASVNFERRILEGELAKAKAQHSKPQPVRRHRGVARTTRSR